ncbi:MAG: hypothetical protein J5949_03270, partial [Oscillospiraceae bacterium]|nr:hypothetical protein [Oscillospiraceae bacterium]
MANQIDQYQFQQNSLKLLGNVTKYAVQYLFYLAQCKERRKQLDAILRMFGPDVKGDPDKLRMGLIEGDLDFAKLQEECARNGIRIHIADNYILFHVDDEEKIRDILNMFAQQQIAAAKLLQDAEAAVDETRDIFDEVAEEAKKLDQANDDVADAFDEAKDQIEDKAKELGIDSSNADDLVAAQIDAENGKEEKLKEKLTDKGYSSEDAAYVAGVMQEEAASVMTDSNIDIYAPDFDRQAYYDAVAAQTAVRLEEAGISASGISEIAEAAAAAHVGEVFVGLESSVMEASGSSAQDVAAFQDALRQAVQEHVSPAISEYEAAQASFDAANEKYRKAMTDSGVEPSVEFSYVNAAIDQYTESASSYYESIERATQKEIEYRTAFAAGQYNEAASASREFQAAKEESESRAAAFRSAAEMARQEQAAFEDAYSYYEATQAPYQAAIRAGLLEKGASAELFGQSVIGLDLASAAYTKSVADYERAISDLYSTGSASGGAANAANAAAEAVKSGGSFSMADALRHGASAEEAKNIAASYDAARMARESSNAAANEYKSELGAVQAAKAEVYGIDESFKKTASRYESEHPYMFSAGGYSSAKRYEPKTIDTSGYYEHTFAKKTQESPRRYEYKSSTGRTAYLMRETEVRSNILSGNVFARNKSALTAAGDSPSSAIRPVTSSGTTPGVPMSAGGRFLSGV